MDSKKGGTAMQKDMHYDGVYALARAAGFTPDAALVVATSSQYVDDALDDEPFDLNSRLHKGSILPAMTSHKPMDYRNAIESDQWRVWLPFHFLPGGELNPAGPHKNQHEERLTCRKNSERPTKANDAKTPANRIIHFAAKHVNKRWGLHLAGIVTHVYADTFAHYGFIGRSTPRNCVKNSTLKFLVEKPKIKTYVKRKKELFLARNMGRIAETIPVGHGAVATFPDRPYLRWKVTFEDGRKMPMHSTQWRDNRQDFLEASEYLFVFFQRLLRTCPKYACPGRTWPSIKQKVTEIIAFEGTKEERVKKWGAEAKAGNLFETQAGDIENGAIVSYIVDDKQKSGGWKPGEIAKLVASGNDPRDINGVLFFHAARLLRRFIHEEVLGGLGLIAQI
jgi:hypothetical protein